MSRVTDNMIHNCLSPLIDELSLFTSRHKLYLWAGTGLASSLLTCYGLYCKRYRWVKVGEVAELYLYPLKSGKALSVREMECGLLAPSLGEVQDRGFMVVTTRGTGVDLRCGHDRLVLIQLSHLGHGQWELSAPGQEPCTFTAPYDGEEEVEEITFSHLDTTVSGADCGDDPSAWISQFLGAELRLIQHKRCPVI